MSNDEHGDGIILLTGYTPADAAVLVEADRDPEHRRPVEFPEDSCRRTAIR